MASYSMPKAFSPAHSVDCAEQIRLLVADDSRMGCQLLSRALTRSRFRFHVAACAATRPEILDSLSTLSADVALINEDLQEGPYTGFQILGELRAGFPKTRVILLLKSSSQELVVDAFRGGAKGIFFRSEPFEALCKCIRAVHRGQIWANSGQLELVLQTLVQASPLRLINAQRRCLLARREDEVVNLVADGLTNREVAAKLGLSEHTVSNYLFRIYEKLGISSRVELVLYFLRQRQPE